MKHTLHLLVLLFYALSGNAQIITTVAGNGGSTLGDGGPAINASLNGPYAIAFDSHGNMYVTDGYHHRIRKIDLAGNISTIAGTGVSGYNGDNIPATTAQVDYPVGIIFDGSDNLIFCDASNNRVRKIDIMGVITTVAGNGATLYNGDNIQATTAAIYNPHCVAVDAAGNLYITDNGNHRVRKVNTAGIITTIAGTGASGYDGDSGPATSAKINGPYGIALDAVGNIYFADDWESVVRKIDTAGIITTFAGNDTATTLGDFGPATAAALNHPAGIIIDNSGNLFIANISQERIRKVAPTGIITTVAGVGTLGFSGDNGPATNAQIAAPVGIAVNGTGALYIADFANNRVRRIGWPVLVNDPDYIRAEIQIYPNPSAGNFTCAVSSATDQLFNLSIIDMAGRVLKELTTETGKLSHFVLTQPGQYKLIARSQTTIISMSVIVNN